MVIVGAVTLAVVLNRQDADLRSRLAAATAAADTANPPGDTRRVRLGPGGDATASPHAPHGLPSAKQVATARSERSPVVEEVSAAGTEYLTRTVMHGDTVVQAGVDFGPRDAERSRLLLGLGIAGAVAAGAAALLGVWLSRRALAPLEEAMSRQRRFVADASHELRTPLARLNLRAQMLQRHAQARGPSGEMASDASLLAKDARDTAAIVDDLLMSAQLEQSPLDGELVDLGAVVARVVEADRPRAAERDICLDLRAAASAPVRGVPVALTRAVTALVDNALGHTPDGGHIEVRVEPTQDGSVLLSVTDDGPGVEPDEGERLFDRFARAERGDRSGFGLGLALVREVVEAHRGRIGLDAKHTPGARFLVTLPVARS